MSYNTESLLSMIEVRASIPLNQSTFSEEEILAVADDIIKEMIMPDILKARQELNVYYDDIVPTKRTSDNYSWVRVPKRAIGNSIIEVTDTDDEALHQSAYWIEGNKIFFDPEISDPVRVKYHMRPGNLVLIRAIGNIKAINRVDGDIVVSATPSTFTTDMKYDLVKADGGFELLAKDVSIPTIVGTTLTFAVGDIPEDLEVGDYVCLSEQSPVPQIPVEWFPYLAQHTAASLLNSLGDYDAAKKVESRLGTMRDNALSLISPRVAKKSKPIIPTCY